MKSQHDIWRGRVQEKEGGQEEEEDFLDKQQYEPPDKITVHVVPKTDLSSRFFNNTEADASELLENFEEICPRYFEN